MRDAYSQHKVAWHLDRIEAMRRGDPLGPVHVQMVISDLCNQDCHFCAYRISTGLSTELFATAETHNPDRRIERAKALSILQECSALGVRAVQFTGGGEPTVHPDHLRIFGYAQAFGMQTSLVTNGVKLDPEAGENLAHAWVRVSVDAGTAETYARVRRVSPAHFERVWRNVERFADRYRGVLGIGFVMTPQNYAEAPLAARRAREAGAASIRLGAVFTTDGSHYYDGAMEQVLEAAQAAREEERPGFEVIDLIGRRIADLDEGSPDEAFCGYQYFTTYIGGDLNVYRCCNTAYTPAGLLGNLGEKTLRECLAGLAPFDATKCRHCQFLGQNRAIAALLAEPLHKDFV